MPDAKRNHLAADRAYLALGSNLGPREANVLRAVRSLEEEGIARVIRVSSLYETEPVDCGDAPDFINAVVEVRPLLRAEDLLERLQFLESGIGRRGGHNAPREIDVDIITYGLELRQGERLVLPHPRYHLRRFVLMPLAEIAPEFRCPRSGRGVEEMLDGLEANDRVALVSSRRLAAVVDSLT